MRRLYPVLRESAETVEEVPALLLRKLNLAMQDAIAAARDAIEAARKPSDRDIAAALVEGVEGAIPRPKPAPPHRARGNWQCAPRIVPSGTGCNSTQLGTKRAAAPMNAVHPSNELLRALES